MSQTFEQALPNDSLRQFVEPVSEQIAIGPNLIANETGQVTGDPAAEFEAAYQDLLDHIAKDAWNRGQTRACSVPQRRRWPQRTVAVGLAAILMLGASFHAGQRLPPNRCREVFERIAPRTAAGLPAAEQAPARLAPLGERRCEECGKRLWPLLKPGETCPYCEAMDQNAGHSYAEGAEESKRTDQGAMPTEEPVTQRGLP